MLQTLFGHKITTRCIILFMILSKQTRNALLSNISRVKCFFSYTILHIGGGCMAMPVMSGGDKKVTHTSTNLQIKLD